VVFASDNKANTRTADAAPVYSFVIGGAANTTSLIRRHNRRSQRGAPKPKDAPHEHSAAAAPASAAAGDSKSVPPAPSASAGAGGGGAEPPLVETEHHAALVDSDVVQRYFFMLDIQAPAPPPPSAASHKGSGPGPVALLAFGKRNPVTRPPLMVARDVVPLQRIRYIALSQYFSAM
jgi:hypothetical protein